MNIKSLKEKKNSLIAEMEQITNVVEVENRALESEEISKYEELKKLVEQINSTIEALETSKEIAEESKEQKKEGNEMTEEKRSLAEVELRAITSTTHGDAIPEGLHGEILKKLEEKSAVYAEAKKVDYVGDLAVLIDGENAEASILDETEELTETDLGTFEKVVLKDKRVATLVTVSKHMLNNSPVLTMDLIADKVATRVANTIENQIFNADGTSKKMTSGLLVKGTKIDADITIENILSMVGGMKAGYLNGAKFYCNRETFKALCGLIDGNKRPYIVADVINNKPAYTLLGVPVVVTDVLKGELVLANLAEAVMVKHGQTPQVEILQETFALKGSYGIMCEAFVDCAVVNPEAVIVLKKTA
ncbi:phage major capsid protein [Clostridium paraputrificum]|uniref:phage major capsid protein n=1 Tax=Clostridium paraputrificum TaxID=29363 RepID=UPI002FCDB5F5